MALDPSFIELLNEYFRASKDPKTAKADIKTFIRRNYYGKFSVFQADFYQNPLHEDQKLDLLLNLRVHPNQWILFLGQPLSLYGLLNRLSKEGMGPQFPWVLDLIERKKDKRTLSYFLPILPFLPSVLILYMDDLIHFMMQNINYMPIVGIAAALAIFAYCYYANDSNMRMSDNKIKIEKYSIIISNTFILAGKILLVFAEALLVTIAQYLFLAAALVGVLTKLVHLREVYKRQDILEQDEPLDSKTTILHYQKYARLSCERIKQRNELFISIGCALIITGLALTCVICPHSLILSIAISASTFLVFALELIAIKLNERYLAKTLHINLALIGTWNIPNEENIEDPILANRGTTEPLTCQEIKRIATQNNLAEDIPPTDTAENRRGTVPPHGENVRRQLQQRLQPDESKESTGISSSVGNMLQKYNTQADTNSGEIKSSSTSVDQQTKESYKKYLTFYRTYYLDTKPEDTEQELSTSPI